MKDEDIIEQLRINSIRNDPTEGFLLLVVSKEVLRLAVLKGLISNDKLEELRSEAVEDIRESLENG